MSERFCSLIVFAPGAPGTIKFHLSRGAIMILLAAFVLSFLAVVLLGYTFPSEINEVHRAKLAAENQALKIEAADAELRIQRLNAKVSELEETSKRIHTLVEEPTS
jgi:Tfp pilus assembly protein PilO